MESKPSHHLDGGGYCNPWPPVRERNGGVLRWRRERAAREIAPDPDPSDLPRVESRVARPRACPGEIRTTWVGHATFLLQIGGLNVVTDPVWSRRASPFQWIGPARFTPPGLEWNELPIVDLVLVSHDHYDHLDDGTVRRLLARYGDDLCWAAPLGYRRWLERRGVRNLVELDWWEATEVETDDGCVEVSCLPARHWSRRTPWDSARRLWSSWALRGEGGGAVYFGGDSGWFPGYPEIGAVAGPFDAVLLPIGAYDPAWFMSAVHLNPEEAVQAYLELGGRGLFCGMHWGTFRLSDEDPLEPPRRTRKAWRAAELPEDLLWLPRHGETRMVV